MRFVLHSFCGMPLRAGAILIGLFTAVVSSVAFGDVLNKVLKSDHSEIYITREEWLNHMAVKASLCFLLFIVCLMQFIGGIKESRVLIIPFVVLATYFVLAIFFDQIISIFLGVVDYEELRGIVSPSVSLLFFVWIDISYIGQLNQRLHDAIKPGLLDP